MRLSDCRLPVRHVTFSARERKSGSGKVIGERQVIGREAAALTVRRRRHHHSSSASAAQSLTLTPLPVGPFLTCPFPLMADSLEDFFARKDRAKKTKSKKVPAADDPAARTEEPVKEKKKEKEKAAAQQPVPAQDEEESEWKEVEYEKDYSGLKIHSMTIRDKEEEIREQKLQEATEQAESKKNDSSGPWKTSSAPAVDTVKQQHQHPVEEVRDEKRADAEVAQKAKYVPPGMRNQMASQANGPLAPARMRSLKAGKVPEIENQSEFPSLGAAVPEVEPDQKPVPSVNSWKDSTVRSGVRTENKFDVLSEN